MQRFSKDEMSKFRAMLFKRRETLAGNVSRMSDSALSNHHDSGNDFNHMADMGTDNYDQEFAIGRIENEEDELRAIDEAIQKVDAGTYGACETCGQPIPKTRLKALPFASLCIRCKELEEKSA